MIRWVLFALWIVPSTLLHALAAIVAALLGVQRRPGGGGVYDWATVDWSRRLLRVAGTPVVAEGLERIPAGQPVRPLRAGSRPAGSVRHGSRRPHRP